MGEIFNLLEDTTFYTNYIEQYNLNHLMQWLIIIILTTFYLAQFINLIKSNKSFNLITDYLILSVLVILVNLAISIMFNMIFSFLREFNISTTLLLLNTFGFFELLFLCTLLLLIVHSLFNFIIYIFKDSLINYDLKLVKENNSNIFKKKYQQQQNLFEKLSIIHNQNLKRINPSNMKRVKKHYIDYQKAAEILLDKDKIYHQNITEIFRISVLIQVGFLAIINALIINVVFNTSTDNINQLLLVILGVFLIQVMFLKIIRLIK